MIKKVDIFKRPLCVTAADAQKGQSILLELLIFAVVFFIASIASGIAGGIIMVVYMFCSPGFLELLLNYGTDTSAIMQSVYSSDALVVISLFCTVFTIAATIIYCRCINKRSFYSLGMVKKGAVGDYIIGMVAGFVIFSAAMAICVLTGSVSISVNSGFSYVLLAVYFLGYIIQGFSEELLCRGYLMVAISRKYSLPVAIAVNSLVFAALHLANSGISVLAFVNLFLFGVFASVCFIKRGSIWMCAAIHSIWNFAQGNFYGIKVSGMSSSTSVLSSVCPQSKALFNGGDFGLEGGLAVTAVLIIGIAVLCFTKSRNVAEQQD